MHVRYLLRKRSLSALNGWDDYPEEINDSALVKCFFKKIISYDEYSAWIVVNILEVVLLSQIAMKYKRITATTNYLDDVGIYGESYILEYDDWLRFDSSAQGDIGSWCLIKKNKHNYHLVIYNEWIFHYDSIYAGNILIGKKLVDEMIKKSINHCKI